MNIVYEKIQVLVDECGYSDEYEMALEFNDQSTVPGICMNVGCEATFDYEPDASEGWCDMCDTHSVQSLLVLMEII